MDDKLVNTVFVLLIIYPKLNFTIGIHSLKEAYPYGLLCFFAVSSSLIETGLTMILWCNKVQGN